jgi:mRNA interferase HigB
MRVISEKRLREFWQKNPEAEKAMHEWVKTVRLADWHNFADVRETFNHSDVFGGCAIFDVGGNKYRIIAKIAYGLKIVFIRFVLTHKEYDDKKWQTDCK